MQYTQHLTIDVFKQEQFQYIHAKQYDHCARQLVITPTANGEAMTIPDTATAVFRCLKHDGTSVVNPATVDATAGTVTVELTDQALACEGMARADVSIIDGENIISTLTFFIMVDKAATSSEQITSSNEFLYIVQVASEVESYTERAEAAASSAEESATVAKEAQQIAESAITDAEATIAAAAEAKASAEAAANSESAAATYASEAEESATAAAESAAAAKTSETNAATSASTATSKASEAETSATEAAGSASAAATSESNASTSESNAASSATAAANSATAAATSESNASESAATAEAKATEANEAATAAQEAQAAAEAARDAAQDIAGGDFITSSELTAHTGDTTVHITAEERTAWNNKSDFDGDYNSLTNQPTIPTVPTKVSELENDAGYLTEIDKTEIINEVLATLPTWEGGNY